MFIPGRENYTEMTSDEFETYTLQLFGDMTKELENVKIEHDIIIDAYDGTYQIDGRISYIAFGVKIVILVECKKYKGPVKREHIQILNDKVKSTGANKGIFVTTSYYQLGAYSYAKLHGIALLTITDGKINYEIRGKQIVTESMYLDYAPKFVTVWQEETEENTIRCVTVDETCKLL